MSMLLISGQGIGIHEISIDAHLESTYPIPTPIGTVVVDNKGNIYLPSDCTVRLFKFGHPGCILTVRTNRIQLEDEHYSLSIEINGDFHAITANISDIE